MSINLAATQIYHITDISNLPRIIVSGGLHADAGLEMAGVTPTVIGHQHIKNRRLHEIRVECAGNRFVGEFVPFYFCPRSPMLYTINLGNTGREPGCQSEIIHLVSNVEVALALQQPWAYSSGNAGARYADFYNNQDFAHLDWGIIGSNSWGGERRDKKAAEFLILNHFPWESIMAIGCYNDAMVNRVNTLIQAQAHKPVVSAQPGWYY